MWHVLSPPLTLEGGMRIVSFTGTLSIHVLNDVTSSVILDIHALLQL